MLEVCLKLPFPFQTGAMTSAESCYLQENITETKIQFSAPFSALSSMSNRFHTKAMTAHLHNIDAKQHSENLAAFLYSWPTNVLLTLPLILNFCD